MAFQYAFFIHMFYFTNPLETQLFLGRLPGTAEAWQWHILIVPNLIFALV